MQRSGPPHKPRRSQRSRVSPTAAVLALCALAAPAAVAALPWPFGRALIKPAGAASGAAPAAGGVFLYGGITVGATVSGRLQVAGAGSHAPQLLPALQRSRALPPLDEAKAQFVAQHPEYGYNGWLDANWEQEIGVRMPPGSHYIDFTASGLYTNGQLAAATQELATHVYGNPHCTSPSSLLVDEELREARHRVLRHFNADSEEYTVVFTRSATEALKLVGESYPWTPAPGWHPRHRVPPGGVNETSPGRFNGCGAYNPSNADLSHSTYVYLRANHKSVLGIGAIAREQGTNIACVDEAGMEAWLDSAPDPEVGGRGGDVTYSLVAYPAKDNYEGRFYPLAWIDKVHARSTQRHKWLVVLDAAAHAPTHPLDLGKHKADFVPLSFYKLFGLPTGAGALILRREAAAALRVVYFGGGSVLDATAEGCWRMLMPFPEGMETGTMPFLDIIQLKYGFQLFKTLGGVHAISAHTESLRAWTYERLSALRHSNGAPLLRIFGAHDRGHEHQSALFQFVVLRANGSAVAAPQVQSDAGKVRLHLRAGCDCNPGQCLFDLGIKPEEERARALSGDLEKPFITVMRPVEGDPTRLAPVVLPTGSVRASLGSLSTFEDMYALVAFLATTYTE